MLPVILPLISFSLPVIVILRSAKRPVRKPYRYSLASFAAALGALCQEVWVFRRRADAGDISGICDTAGAVLALCAAIAAVTLLLNLIALGLSYEDD